MSDFKKRLREALARHAYDIKQGGDIHHDFAIEAISHLIDTELIGENTQKPYALTTIEEHAQDELRAVQRLRLKGGSDER